MNLHEAIRFLKENNYTVRKKMLTEFVSFKKAWELIKKSELTDDEKDLITKYSEEMEKQDPENTLSKALKTKIDRLNKPVTPVKEEIPEEELDDDTKLKKLYSKFKYYYPKIKTNAPQFFLERHDVDTEIDGNHITFWLHPTSVIRNYFDKRKMKSEIKNELKVLEIKELKINDENRMNYKYEEEFFQIIIKAIKKEFNLDLSNNFCDTFNDGCPFISQEPKQLAAEWKSDIKKLKELLETQGDVRHIHNWSVMWQTKHKEGLKCITCGKTKTVYTL